LICTIASCLGKHTEALDHSKTAVISCFHKIFSIFSTSNINTNPDWVHANRLIPEVQSFLDWVTLLVIAHYNMAAEYEHLGKISLALSTYQEAITWTEKYLNKAIPEGTLKENEAKYDHQLYTKLRKCINVCRYFLRIFVKYFRILLSNKNLNSEITRNEE
jgi:hypothetical protein